MPEASYGVTYLHPSAVEMAAAYLFHIVRNHPFVDGNKRIGLIAALAFLGLNHLTLDADADALFDLVLGVAAGLPRSTLTPRLEGLNHSRRPSKRSRAGGATTTRDNATLLL